MANIDLIVNFSHPAAISNTIRYARIDNTVTPAYTTIPGILPGQDPYTIAGVPNGQYRIGIKPVYSDGRLCNEVFFETPACSGVNSFSAAYDGADIVVTYNVDVAVPSVRVNVNFPNGGSGSYIYANGDPIEITPPPNVSGTYYLTLQPVCDEDTGFFGAATPPVAVNILLSQNVYIYNVNPEGSDGSTITSVTGIPGFAFGAVIPEGGSQSGNHIAGMSAIHVTINQVSGPGDVNNGISLKVNGILIQCYSSALPGVSVFIFDNLLLAASDVVQITYNFAECGASPGSIFSGNYSFAVAEIDVCAAPSTILYSSAPFGGGVKMYTDPGLTSSLAGYSYILNASGNVYNIHPGTGIVGLATGGTCP